jgi:hypothetical protein
LSDQEAISTCRLLAKESGLLVGGSSGLVLCGSIAWLKQTPVRSVVAIIPDSGANYLDQIYNDEWLAEKGITLLDHNELDEHLQTKQIFDVEAYCSEQPSRLELSHVAAAL